MGKKIKTKLMIEIETDYNDEDSNDKTTAYCVEQDLEDIGWQVNKVKVLNTCSYGNCNEIATEQGGSGAYYCHYHFKQETGQGVL